MIEKSPIESFVAPEAKAALRKAVDFLEELGCVVEPIGWPVDGVEVMKNYYGDEQCGDGGDVPRDGG